MTGEHGLRRLESRLASDLDQLRYRERRWVRPRRTAGGALTGPDLGIPSLRSFAEQEF